jgi:DNA-binding HxlR family transcriptional regulator
MTYFEVCPTKLALNLFKKWSFEVVRDIWFGLVTFSEILKANHGLSTKVLSQRLKELEKYGIIEKKIISVTPLRAKYQLTEKGLALNRIMYDFAMFSYDYYLDKLFQENAPSRSEMAEKVAKAFKIDLTNPY